jgi:fumarylpyruvate hydrolase
MATYLFSPPAVPSLLVRGKTERFPINRIFCVGRNYHAHAVEMGRPVDKSVEQAFYFTKSPQTLVESGATVAYPPRTHRAPTTTTSRWNSCWRLAKQVFA